VIVFFENVLKKIKNKNKKGLDRITVSILCFACIFF